MAVHSVQPSEQEHYHVIHPLLDRHNYLYVSHKPHLLSLGCGGSQGGPHTQMFSQPPTPDVLVEQRP